jgi:hypothetical protein
MSIDEGLDGRLIPRVASKTPLPTLRTVHPTSLRRLCPPEADASTMNIICSWSTTGGGAREARICGEHHLRQLSVRPRKKSKGCPITITAKHPTKVSHHFASGSLVSCALFCFTDSFRLLYVDHNALHYYVRMTACSI